MQYSTIKKVGHPPMPTVISFIAQKADRSEKNLIKQVLKILQNRDYRAEAIVYEDCDSPVGHSWKNNERKTSIDSKVISSNFVAAKQRQGYSNEEELIAASFSGMDIILIEGLKQGSLAKIKLQSEREDIPGKEEPLNNLIAVASATDIDCDVPVLNLFNPFEIADFIQFYAERKNEQRNLSTIQSISVHQDTERIWW